MNALPSLQAEHGPTILSLQTVEAVLGALLAAHKAGALAELVQRRPRATRWLARRYLSTLRGTAGDAWAGASAPVDAVSCLLRWAISQLRPDRRPELVGIERACWLDAPNWRPVLALACHYGFEPVPEFRDRYRRHADEAPADNLCGLWSIGSSTFYRHLEQGKRRIAQLLANWPPDAERQLSLRGAALSMLDAHLSALDASQRAQWHLRQSAVVARQADAASALWHALQASDPHTFIALIERLRTQLAASGEAELLIEQFARTDLAAADSCALWLAWASVWRTRNLPERELAAYERAQQIAAASEQSRLLGNVSSALGRFYEARDTDRALAYLEDATEFLRQASEQSGEDTRGGLANDYAATLLKLAWLYLVRNDPRCRALLERAERARDARASEDETSALLEQAWGEYWYRAGEVKRALEHKHRALNVFERLGDTRQVLSTFNNLSTIYVEAGDCELAVAYAQRVLDARHQVPVEPYLLSSAQLSLGVAFFWQGNLDNAIEHYRAGLREAETAGLLLLANRAHYNLAEAYYKRYQAGGHIEDEHLGDQHTSRALSAGPQDSDTGLVEAARVLKQEILGEGKGFVLDRLLSEEFAAHFDDMSEVQRQRALLASPEAPNAHVRAHLSIALAHLNVATKEREAARRLIDKHGLPDGAFAAEFDRLGQAFNRGLTHEQRLASIWRKRVDDLIPEDRLQRVLQHALQVGSINKSTYADVCGVSPATASKHLALLTERGLLSQTGKGPSTRYVLP